MAGEINNLNVGTSAVAPSLSDIRGNEKEAKRAEDKKEAQAEVRSNEQQAVVSRTGQDVRSADKARADRRATTSNPKGPTAPKDSFASKPPQKGNFLPADNKGHSDKFVNPPALPTLAKLQEGRPDNKSTEASDGQKAAEAAPSHLAQLKPTGLTPKQQADAQARNGEQENQGDPSKSAAALASLINKKSGAPNTLPPKNPAQEPAPAVATREPLLQKPLLQQGPQFLHPTEEAHQPELLPIQVAVTGEPLPTGSPKPLAKNLAGPKSGPSLPTSPEGNPLVLANNGKLDPSTTPPKSIPRGEVVLFGSGELSPSQESDQQRGKGLTMEGQWRVLTQPPQTAPAATTALAFSVSVLREQKTQTLAERLKVGGSREDRNMGEEGSSEVTGSSLNGSLALGFRRQQRDMPC